MNTNTVTASNSHGILAEEITRLRTLAKAQNDMISRVLDFWLGGDMPAGWAEEMLKLIERAQSLVK